MGNLKDPDSFDCVIVGNGALGLSLGISLLKRGQSVALLGPPGRAGGASAAAGAMFGCFGEVTDLVAKSPHGKARHELAVQASRGWDGWLAELAEGSGMHTDGTDIRTADGTFVILNAIGVPGIDDANFAAIRAALIEAGEPFEDVDPAAIEWLDPDAKSRPHLAMNIPGEHAVDASALLQRLERTFVSRGGSLIAESAVDLRRSANSIVGVTLASGDVLSAANVVLAAGVQCQQLLDTIPDTSCRIPRLISGYGVSALVETQDGKSPVSVIRTPNRAFACGLHVVPRSAGTVYVGATNILSVEPRTKPVVNDALFLLGCATRQVRRNLSNSDLSRIQVGNRPVSLDGFPLLGPVDLNGLWLMTGTYRDGLFLSPMLGEEMAARIAGEPGRLDLEMFTPVRSPIQALTRAETVDTAVVHMMATGYEYDWDIPIEWPYLMEETLRQAYRRVADDLDPDFTPPPEILAGLRIRPTLDKALRDYYQAVRD